MLLQIEQIIRDSIVAYCRTELPFEACGGLFGPDKSMLPENPVTITEWTPIANRSTDPAFSFQFDGKGWIDSLYSAESNRLKLLGIFHSHPTAPAKPSVDDIAGATLGPVSYWIVSFAVPGIPDLAAYRPASDSNGSLRFIPVPYTIVV